MSHHTPTTSSPQARIKSHKEPEHTFLQERNKIEVTYSKKRKRAPCCALLEVWANTLFWMCFIFLCCWQRGQVSHGTAHIALKHKIKASTVQNSYTLAKLNWKKWVTKGGFTSSCSASCWKVFHQSFSWEIIVFFKCLSKQWRSLTISQDHI